MLGGIRKRGGRVQVVLDEMGAEAGCSLMSREGELLVTRPEAVYLYRTDSRGSCYVFQGPTSPLPPYTPATLHAFHYNPSPASSNFTALLLGTH